MSEKTTHLEVEVKILNVDVQKIETILLEQGAKVIFDGEQEQWNHHQEGGGARFRVRKETGSREQVVITIKSHLSPSEGELHADKETEYIVESAEKGMQEAKEQGFVLASTVNKHRKEYALGTVHFCFDTPHTKYGNMATYLEIESNSEENVFLWVEKLGFTKEDIVTKGAGKLIAAFENVQKELEKQNKDI